MGKLNSFYVAFNNNANGVYHPGQFISGTVIVDLNAAMDMRALKLKFHGQANVHWTESHQSGNTTTTHHYRGKETYFDQTVILFGKGSGGSTEEAKQLPPGQNVYPFNFQLPINLPSSFEGAHGNVRYYIKASIDKPWKFDHNTKTVFTVLDMVDLNQDPNARLPVTSNDSKTLCCLCCASGPIQAQAHLDRTGYVPGEFILVNASVDNASSSNMPATSASLIQQVTFRATSKSRTVNNKVATISGPGCNAGKSIEWNNERFQIPPLPPSMLRFCNIIIINYFLEFCVVVPSGSFNLRVKLPIMLGSIPLQGLTPYVLPPPLPNVAAVPPTATFAPSAPPPAVVQPEAFSAPPAYEPPPPSYAASFGGEVNIQDDDDNQYLMGQTSYTPQYAYYDWSQSAFTYSNTK